MKKIVTKNEKEYNEVDKQYKSSDPKNLKFCSFKFDCTTDFLFGSQT